MAIRHLDTSISDQQRKQEIRKLWATIKANAKFNCGKNPMWHIPLRLLSVDDDYQRWNHQKLAILVKVYTEDRTEPIVVSYRDGYLFIVNGMHRCFGALAKGYDTIPAVMWEDLTKQNEAEWFAMQDSRTAKLSCYDIFRANIVWGEVIDTKIKNVCDKFGITVVQSIKDNYEISAIDGCRKIVKRYDVDALTWIFDILYNSKWFEQGKMGVSTKTINALARAYHQALQENDASGYADRLMTVLRQASPREVNAFAAMREHHMEHRAAATAVLQDIGAGNVTINDIKNMLATAGKVARN